MLRTISFALMLGAPAFAAAEQFPESPVGVEVRGERGVVIGRVAAVERDENGNIVAAEIPGLEPGSAPHPSRDLVAEAQRELVQGVSERRERVDVAVNAEIRIR